MHRVRDELVHARTALINQLRGLLVQFGVVVPRAAIKRGGNPTAGESPRLGAPLQPLDIDARPPHLGRLGHSDPPSQEQRE